MGILNYSQQLFIDSYLNIIKCLDDTKHEHF